MIAASLDDVLGDAPPLRLARRPLSFEEFAERIGADAHAGQVDPLWAGECPVDGTRRGLHMLPDADGSAEVYCVAGCDPEEILRVLAIDPDPAYFHGAHAGRFVLLHSLPGLVSSGPSNPFLSRTMSLADLAGIPEPEPLIEDTLDRRTEILLLGQPASGKSFVSLDWAASIATGTPWNGRAVSQGPVLYIAGEGVYGIRQRLLAWQEHHGVMIGEDLAIYPEAAQPNDPAVRAFLAEAVAVREFALVVVDTLARSALGVEENSATDLGAWLGNVRAATVEAGAMTSVLIVHHTTKDGRSARGSGALMGVMDTAYKVESDGPGGVALKRVKRKDGPLDDEHAFRFKPVGPSVVLDPVSPLAPGPYFDPVVIMAEEIRAYLTNAPGATQNRIEEAVEGRASDVREVLGELVRTGAIRVEPGPRNSRCHFLTEVSRWSAPEVPFGSIEPEIGRLSPRVFGREPGASPA